MKVQVVDRTYGRDRPGGCELTERTIVLGLKETDLVGLQEYLHLDDYKRLTV